MSGFSADWLDLRAPADAAARAPAVLDAMGAYCADRSELAICDLGAGVGATALAIRDRLPAGRRWRLVDLDAGNLAEAERRLRAAGEDVETAIVDLSGDPAAWPEGAALVTASALFDLASAEWIERFVAALARDRAALLAMLTYDGRQTFAPALADDAAMLDAFNRHQRLDKGLGGPAAGPDATAILARSLDAAGYRVVQADSPWRLTAGRDSRLMEETLRGWAMAVAEAGYIDHRHADAWLTARLARTASMAVGHVDLFASPA